VDLGNCIYSGFDTLEEDLIRKWRDGKRKKKETIKDCLNNEDLISRIPKSQIC
jgi:hypothetical protein